MSGSLVTIEVSTPVAVEELVAILAFAIAVDGGAMVDAGFQKVFVTLSTSDFVLALQRMNTEDD